MAYYYFNEGRDQHARAFIVVAVTRLMARLGFTDNDIVDDMVSDFSRSKDLEVMLRCLEYEKIYELKDDLPEDCGLGRTPMTTAAVLVEDFDYSMNFLENFVQSQLDEGKSTYKSKKRTGDGEAGRGKKKQEELKIKPYSNPSVGGVQFNANPNNPRNNPMFKPSDAESLVGDGQQPQMMTTMDQPKDGSQDPNLQIGDVRKIWQVPEGQTEEYVNKDELQKHDSDIKKNSGRAKKEVVPEGPNKRDKLREGLFSGIEEEETRMEIATEESKPEVSRDEPPTQ
jgi:hypothetical protein